MLEGLLVKRLVTILLLIVVLAAFIQPAMAEKPYTAVNNTYGNGNDKPGQNNYSSKPDIRQNNATPTAKNPPQSNIIGRNDWLHRSKNGTIAGINLIIRDINVYRDRIQASKLSADDRAAIIAEIDANLTWFESKKQEVQEAPDTATIRKIALEAGQRWLGLKADIKKQTGMLACDEYDVKLKQANNASGIVQARIDMLKARGNNTGPAEKKLADYNDRVMKASSYVAQAREAFGKIDGQSGADIHFRNGLQLMAKADIELKQAYVDLKQLYRLLYGNRINK